MNETGLKLEGLAELQEALVRLGAVFGQKMLARVTRLALRPVEAAARDLAPVRTGALRESIRLSVLKPPSGPVVSGGLKVGKRKIRFEIEDDEGGSFKGTMTFDAKWRWHFSELGVPSRGIPAHPFLRPAFEQNTGKVLETLKDALRRAIDREVRRRARGGGK